jgi:hypothetical protein
MMHTQNIRPSAHLGADEVITLFTGRTILEYYIPMEQVF